MLLGYQRRGQRLLQGMLGKQVSLDDVVFYSAATLGALSAGVRPTGMVSCMPTLNPSPPGSLMASGCTHPTAGIDRRVVCQRAVVVGVACPLAGR